MKAVAFEDVGGIFYMDEGVAIDAVLALVPEELLSQEELLGHRLKLHIAVKTPEPFLLK